jgi:hypothetical protein
MLRIKAFQILFLATMMATVIFWPYSNTNVFALSEEYHKLYSLRSPSYAKADKQLNMLLSKLKNKLQPDEYERALYDQRSWLKNALDAEANGLKEIGRSDAEAYALAINKRIDLLSKKYNISLSTNENTEEKQHRINEEEKHKEQLAKEAELRRRAAEERQREEEQRRREAEEGQRKVAEAEAKRKAELAKREEESQRRKKESNEAENLIIQRSPILKRAESLYQIALSLQKDDFKGSKEQLIQEVLSRCRNLGQGIKKFDHDFPEDVISKNLSGIGKSILLYRVAIIAASIGQCKLLFSDVELGMD